MTHRLLFIDDNAALRDVMKAYFSRFGYEVDVAESVAHAECMLAEHCYSLVVSDFNLGAGGTALDLVEYINYRYPCTPVILLSAYVTPEIEAMARRAGVCRVMSKPKPLVSIAEQVADVLWERYDRYVLEARQSLHAHMMRPQLQHAAMAQ